MNNTQRNAILAGLRLLQAELTAGRLSDDIRDILTYSGDAIGIDEIDDLCEQFNHDRGERP